jgi:nucleotide-binding universal stress UspA family protein
VLLASARPDAPPDIAALACGVEEGIEELLALLAEPLVVE